MGSDMSTSRIPIVEGSSATEIEAASPSPLGWQSPDDLVRVRTRDTGMSILMVLLEPVRSVEDDIARRAGPVALPLVSIPLMSFPSSEVLKSVTTRRADVDDFREQINLVLRIIAVLIF